MGSHGVEGGAARPARAVVRLLPPVVRGDRVDFAWDGDHPDALQLRRRWSMRLDGVPLDRLHRAVLHDVLLTLQLPVWARLADRVVVRLAEPVPSVVLDWWRAWHGASHVTFEGPPAPAGGHEPFVGRRPPLRAGAVAVSYGGGKDSTLAAHALLASRPAEDVLLLHVVQHFSSRPVSRLRTEARSRRTVLAPARRATGSPVQVVRIDFLSTLTPAGRAVRPHVNLYTAALLPALLHHGVGAVTVSRTAGGYTVRDAPDGTRVWANASGRPERLLALSRYYASVLGVPLGVESTHYAVTETVSFRALQRLHPEAHAGMVMCMRTRARRRFCGACPKCTEFALLALSSAAAAGRPDALVTGLDLDRLLARSPHVLELVAAARATGDRVAWHGSGPFAPAIGTRSHFAGFCHALHEVREGGVVVDLGRAARDNLAVLTGTWGRRAFPAVTTVDERALRACGPLAREVALHAAGATGVRALGEDLADVLLVGNARARFDHDLGMPVPELDAVLAGTGRGEAAPSGTDPLTA
ncbi:hypothetical protein [Aquipuribacter sp. SD81]|uniref:hypothetical protein n=1 Tax=Aquipuribacter sp. SD81 TaxID=3127703 RepID=UPI00301B05E5